MEDFYSVQFLDGNEVAIMSDSYFAVMDIDDARALRNQIFRGWTRDEMREFIVLRMRGGQCMDCRPLCDPCRNKLVMCAHVLQCVNLFCPVCLSQNDNSGGSQEVSLRKS
jgi:hypothetical protein